MTNDAIEWLNNHMKDGAIYAPPPDEIKAGLWDLLVDRKISLVIREGKIVGILPLVPRLYQVDEGGADWWVGAQDETDAIAVVQEHLRETTGETVVRASVKPVSQDTAEKLSFRGDDGTASDNMWTEWQRDPARRVVACSEW